MKRPQVLVIDAGLGNIGSVVAALQRHDCNVRRLRELSGKAATLINSRCFAGRWCFRSGDAGLEFKRMDDVDQKCI